jgi:hypothetical protein
VYLWGHPSPTPLARAQAAVLDARNWLAAEIAVDRSIVMTYDYLGASSG